MAKATEKRFKNEQKRFKVYNINKYFVITKFQSETRRRKRAKQKASLKKLVEKFTIGLICTISPLSRLVLRSEKTLKGLYGFHPSILDFYHKPATWQSNGFVKNAPAFYRLHIKRYLTDGINY